MQSIARRFTFKVSASSASSKSLANLPAPRTENQIKYAKLLDAELPHIVVGSGAAGSGKTLLATAAGLHKLKRGKVKRIVITRPAISVDENHGFLPGTLEQKMEPWTRPVFDLLLKVWPMETIEYMVKQRVIEICPLAYMRGRTFEDAWIICDEAQNCTPSQMLMVMSRIGKDSKLVITGDPRQFDRGFERNGLTDFIDRLERSPYLLESGLVGIVRFDNSDIMRHPVIQHLLDLYE